jgi:hypothetical protein
MCTTEATRSYPEPYQRRDEARRLVPRMGRWRWRRQIHCCQWGSLLLSLSIQLSANVFVRPSRLTNLDRVNNPNARRPGTRRGFRAAEFCRRQFKQVCLVVLARCSLVSRVSDRSIKRNMRLTSSAAFCCTISSDHVRLSPSMRYIYRLPGF